MMSKIFNKNPPPEYLDNAKVLKWAQSRTEMPYGHINDDTGTQATAVYGLAICCYENTESEFYRFSCDEFWEVQQDAPYPSILAAMQSATQLYPNTTIHWFDI